jgi:hypothetical protein
MERRGFIFFGLLKKISLLIQSAFSLCAWIVYAVIVNYNTRCQEYFGSTLLEKGHGADLADFIGVKEFGPPEDEDVNRLLATFEREICV